MYVNTNPEGVIGRQQTWVVKTAESQWISCQEPSQQQQIHNPGLVLTTCWHPTQLQLSFIYVNTKPKEEIGRQQTWVVKTAESQWISCREPSQQQQIHNPGRVLTTCWHPTQLRLSFIYVNTKPEGEIWRQQTWVNKTAKSQGISRWARGRPGESLKVLVSFKGIGVLKLALKWAKWVFAVNTLNR